MINASAPTGRGASPDELKVVTLDGMPIHGRRWIYFEDVHVLAISRQMAGDELLTALAEAGAR